MKNYAIKKSILAHINERSSHAVPTPHGGGIAIGATWFCAIVYLYMQGEIEATLFYALMAGVVLWVVGYIDDMFELRASFRLFTQALVAFCGLYLLDGLSVLDFGVFRIENQFFTNLFAFFMIIWFVNLYNFLDGIDAYAASEALFLASAGYFFFGGDYFLVLIAAVLGFLPWNWHRAKIFMGDSGSTLLGYNIAIFTLYHTNKDAQNFWIWIALFALFWLDATITLWRRYKNGEKLGVAHRRHLYQKVTQKWHDHGKVVRYAMFINMLVFLLLYFVSNMFVLFFVLALLFYAVVLFVDKLHAQTSQIAT